MSKNKDYTKKSFAFTSLVIVVLILVAFIPPFKVGAVSIKRANILSDIVDFNDIATSSITCEDLLDTMFLAMLDESEKDNANNTAIDSLENKPLVDTIKNYLKPVIVDENIITIEDFSDDEYMMSRFYNSLAFESSDRPIRIAVLGDSFIEADIFTADLREQLQLEYGGSGVGFVPFATPLSKYRGTIKHTHEGWNSYNVVKFKQVPDEYKDWFYISGLLSIPKKDASVEYKGVKFRNRIESTNTATILFANRDSTTINVTINDTIKRSYKPAKSDSIARIFIKEPNINKLGIKLSDTENFIGYGVVLEDSIGVSVHNFSVRSNSGMALIATDQNINSQINSLIRYDLIILQYGLNVMSPEVLNYKYYERQLCRIIEYMKRCYPESAILVMGVSDRSVIENGKATTMPAVDAMIESQKNAAKASKVGFWNTFEAMGGNNSMSNFVDKSWASKDHTHIGYQGGKYIASKLVEFLKSATVSIIEQDSVRCNSIIIDSLGGAQDSLSLKKYYEVDSLPAKYFDEEILNMINNSYFDIDDYEVVIVPLD